MNNTSAFELDALDTRIKELVTYARERGGEDRSLLFRNLVDLFLTGKAPQKQPTRQQLIDVIEALIPHVETDSRRTVAELLAQMSKPPLDLALSLAKDDPSVVGELLKSQAFDEDDIIELITLTGRDHHQAIASRNDLSANVWIALARAVPKSNRTAKKPSIALWSDDLGSLEKSTKPATVTPLHPHNQSRGTETSLETGDISDSGPDSHKDKSHTKAPTTPAVATRSAYAASVSSEESQSHGTDRQAASLRILRTDKDIISERLEGANTTDVDIPDNDRENTTSQSVGVKTSADDWSWRSDRDGIVTEVSSTAHKVFAPNQSLIGMGILDMLALNTKLGHPVSRAFQRRSAIHDALVTLDVTDEDNKHWTLEAMPLFNTSSGAFEGYEGILSPVITADKNAYELNDTVKENETVFLDDYDDKPARSKQSTSITDENIDRTRIPAPADQATAKTAPAKAMAEQMMAETAANAVKDVLAETLSSILQSNKPPAAVESEKPEKESTSEINATLHLLEETVLKLAETNSNGGNASSRLQAEIAVACIRSLKEQLNEKGL